ncbi:C6 transcription factor [Stagonosporopsis vannaccii]|nr:C6 transcription factor [Stagonosporopsis vannaccii]
MSYSNLPAPGVGGSSKLPIPRLHKHRSEPPRKTIVNRQNRVSRACLSCRSRKIKCNGLQPRCSNCSETSVPCVYASSRKDRLKTATSHNQEMIVLLRDLRSQVSTDRQARIDDLLASTVEDVADAAATVGDPIDKYRPLEYEDRGEADVSAEVASSGEQDVLDQDPMRNEETRAAGFIGRVSEIQLPRGLHSAGSSSSHGGGPWRPLGDEEATVDGRLEAHRRRYSGHTTPSLLPASKVSFYLDDEVFESDVMVDPLEMPPFESAEKLIQTYMQSAQNFFPILAKKTFVSWFYHYYASVQCGKPYSVSRNWQATLNLVFAIGAVYSHLVKAEWQADDRDHLIYHSRAWMLSMQDPWGFSNPDLPHMQITGLLSFYYLSIGHINRSWILIGNALRSGFALGMHVRNEDGTTSATRKELNSRIWWTHYSFERLVSTLTGRPSLGIGLLCSVPLPRPLASEDIEESIIESRFGDKGKRPLVPHGIINGSHADSSTQPYDDDDASGAGPANSGSYLTSVVKLGEITQAALELYSTNTVRVPWESAQRMIAHQNDELDAWATALPEGLNFFRKTSVVGHRYLREQNALNVLYQTTKILITRPCLCRLDRRIRNQMTTADTFNRSAALICVEAAQSIATLLPAATSDNIVRLYEFGPWWQMTHVIMQSLVVLCLEIVLQAMCASEDRQGLLPSLKKLLRWLRVMRVNNNMAVRAYAISVGLLKKLMSTSRIDVRDLISEDEVLKGYNERSPAASTPAQKHTPYPDVLNPIDESHDSQASSATSKTWRDLQQQHHDSIHEAPQRSPYLTESSQSHKAHFRNPVESLHRPSVLTEHDSEPPLDVYADIRLSPSSGLEQTVFPGCIVTSFDDPNIWAELGLQSTSVGLQ